MDAKAGVVTPNAYDAVPYESFPFSFSQPERTSAVGRLFGLTPPDVRTARVLELGCASGGNLLPLAARYPRASFVGVDFSKVQIGMAEEMRASMGLDNIAFELMSIADITPEFGQFDYIICHGILSWVPEDIGDAIFRVCKENLTENGIALVSYNIYPGWYQARAVRDMLIYHTERFASPAEKIAQSQALLRFVHESINPALAGYREVIANELKILETQNPTYVFHEHLEETNTPFYLHEIASRARALGLEYLGDSNLEIMFLNNFPANVASTLGAADDIVRIEQYLDFITNRRFRISLFCHKQRTLKRNLDAGQIFDFHIGSRFLPVDPASVDLTIDASYAFKAENGVEATAHNRYGAALLLVLANLRGRVISPKDLVKEALALLKKRTNAEAEERTRAVLFDLGLQLVFRGALTVQTVPTDYPHLPPERPRTFLPMLEAVKAGREWGWSQTHQRIGIGSGDRALLLVCDGTRDQAGLVAEIKERIARGELAMQVGGTIPDPAAADKAVNDWVGERLATFATLGLFAK